MHLNWLRETVTFTETEYVSLRDNMLLNSVKISVTTKTEFFELNFFHSDQKILQNHCRSHFSTALDPLTC